jgi:hypothetical protein
MLLCHYATSDFQEAKYQLCLRSLTSFFYAPFFYSYFTLYRGRRGSA